MSDFIETLPPVGSIKDTESAKSVLARFLVSGEPEDLFELHQCLADCFRPLRAYLYEAWDDWVHYECNDRDVKRRVAKILIGHN